MKTITTIEHRVIRKGSMGSDSNRKTYRCQEAVSPHKYKLFARTPRVSATAAFPRRSIDREYSFCANRRGVLWQIFTSEQERSWNKTESQWKPSCTTCVMDTGRWRVYQYLFAWSKSLFPVLFSTMRRSGSPAVASAFFRRRRFLQALER